MYLRLNVNTAAAGSKINATLTILDKPTTRRTESMSVRFAPSASLVNTSGMEIHKVASWVSPLDVTTNGSTHIHYATDSGIRWTGEHTLRVGMLDAGLLAVGEDGRPAPTLMTKKKKVGWPSPADCDWTQKPWEDGGKAADLSYGTSVNLWNSACCCYCLCWCCRC